VDGAVAPEPGRRALRPLDAVEQRVIGCLVEKELSTPDVYPLTLNALVAACNQTTNRDPVSQLSAEDVERTLHRLMGELLVWRDRGSRALKWKHSLDEKIRLQGEAQKAVMAELLLRGAQTPGELRSRTARMHEFAELSQVEETLRALAGRALVEELPRQPGQKERRWRQLLGSGGTFEVGPRGERLEIESDAGVGAVAPVAARPPAPPPAPADPPGPAPPDLAERVAALERRVAELARELARLRGDEL